MSRHELADNQWPGPEVLHLGSDGSEAGNARQGRGLNGRCGDTCPGGQEQDRPTLSERRVRCLLRPPDRQPGGLIKAASPKTPRIVGKMTGFEAPKERRSVQQFSLIPYRLRPFPYHSLPASLKSPPVETATP